MTKLLTMPNPSLGPSAITEIPHEGTVVIIGANGTGKSRLGRWFEERSFSPGTSTPSLSVRRISAQRYANLNQAVQRLSREVANQRLEFGDDTVRDTRVQGDPIVGQMNDSTYVVDALFAERDVQALAFFRASQDTSKPLSHAGPSILDRTQALWQQIFPERELVIPSEEYTLQARPQGGTPYNDTYLSDGERVDLYLAPFA